MRVNAKSLRALVKALKGRTPRSVPGAKPGAFRFYLESVSVGDYGSTPGFNLRDLPATKPGELHHIFSVKGNTNRPGRVSTLYLPHTKEAEITGSSRSTGLKGRLTLASAVTIDSSRT